MTASPRSSTSATAVAVLVAWLASATVPALAQLVPAAPYRAPESPALAEIPRLALPAVDLAKALFDDEERERQQQVAHYAVPLAVAADPWREGTWDLAARPAAGGETPQARWRLRIASPGARSLNLAFDRFRLPVGAALVVLAVDGSVKAGPYGAADVDAHGQLWTPPLETDDLLLELTLPVDHLRDLELRLMSVQHGYAGFGDPAPRSGTCNVDVACPDAEPWWDEARSVGLLSVAGVRFCTGFLLNNTSQDRRPLLLTARHCGITPENAPSLVVTWGHEVASCRHDRRLEAAAPSSTQSGATFLASSAATDFTLVELDDPPPLDARVYYAGWSRSLDPPSGVAVVHFPNTDLKSIAIDRGSTRVTPAFRDQAARFGGHLRVGGWSLGSTEGGSSGAPLFDAGGHVVGLLRGGYAACDLPLPDWFGRLADGWAAGKEPTQRLRDWLDPAGSNALVLDGLDGVAAPAAGSTLR